MNRRLIVLDPVGIFQFPPLGTFLIDGILGVTDVSAVFGLGYLRYVEFFTYKCCFHFFKNLTKLPISPSIIEPIRIIPVKIKMFIR